MDAADLPAADHEDALTGLARLNRLSLADRPFRAALLRAAGRAASRRSPARVLDVATGSSDVVVRLARWAAGVGLDVEWHVCDVSETALGVAARRAAGAGVVLRTLRADLLVETPAVGSDFDLVTNGLFLHHLDPGDVCRVLRVMSGACTREGGGGEVVVSDLRRDRLGLAAAVVSSRLFSRSRVVHFDAPASVRGAYTMEELRTLAASAGLAGATIRAMWPRRMLLECRCGGGAASLGGSSVATPERSAAHG